MDGDEGDMEVRNPGSRLAPSADEEDLEEEEDGEDDDDEEEEEDEDNISISSSIAGDFYVCNLDDHRKLEPFPDSSALHCPQFNGVHHTNGVDADRGIVRSDGDVVNGAQLNSQSEETVVGGEASLRKMESLDDLEMVVAKSSSSSPQNSRSLLLGPDDSKSTESRSFSASRFPFMDEADSPDVHEHLGLAKESKEQADTCLVGSTEVRVVMVLGLCMRVFAVCMNESSRENKLLMPC